MSVTWFSPGPWPWKIGFTDDEKEFRRFLKDFNIEDDSSFVKFEYGGVCHSYTCKEGLMVIITLRLPGNARSAETAGVVVHEVTHAMQELWDYVGETSPGQEAEAYTMQQYVTLILADIAERKKKRRNKKKKPEKAPAQGELFDKKD